jgi:hypothetical protein
MIEGNMLHNIITLNIWVWRLLLITMLFGNLEKSPLIFVTQRSCVCKLAKELMASKIPRCHVLQCIEWYEYKIMSMMTFLMISQQ